MMFFSVARYRPHRFDIYRSAGFSLVELSVVLIIIALLAGSVLIGTSLVRSAQLKSVTSDKSAYENAVLGFKDRYKALPGDMANATDIWGSEITPVNYTNCAKRTVKSTTQLTCNGNGNDSIYEEIGPGWLGNEQFRVWQHLANAGMIDGAYSGVNDCASASFCINPGVNTPIASVENSTFYIADVSREPVGSTWFTFLWADKIPKHFLFFGTVKPDLVKTTGSHPFYPSLTPSEAWGIDDKFDDGFPGRGQIRVFSSLAGTPMTSHYLCATGNGSQASADTATYNRSINTKECLLYFYMAF